jgi:hypothetical protein
MIQMTADTDDAKKETEIVRSKAAKAAKDIQRLAKDREREEARAKEVREGREAGDTRVDDLCHWYVRRGRVAAWRISRRRPRRYMC